LKAKVPRDEMRLAEALAAAHAAKVGWIRGAAFATATSRGSGIKEVDNAPIIGVCAVGALYLAGRWDGETLISREFRDTASGNDYSDQWGYESSDRGESLGWAFRCAMTQEDS
jgi:hypothetical protein